MRFGNITSMTDFMVDANTVSGGVLITSVVVVVALVLFMVSLNYGRAKAMVFSSFITMILLVFLVMGGLIEYWWMVLDGVFLAIGIYFMVKDQPAW